MISFRKISLHSNKKFIRRQFVPHAYFGQISLKKKADIMKIVRNFLEMEHLKVYSKQE